MAKQESVVGDKAVAKAFKAIPEKLRKKALRKVVRAVAKETVLPLARADVPVDTGDLEASLTVRAGKVRRGRPAVAAETRSRDGNLFQGEQYYGGFQEFGWVTQTGRFHPGSPFLRPAIYSDRAAKLASFRKHTWPEMQKVVADERAKQK